MRFPLAALVIAALYVLTSQSEAYAVQACLSAEAQRQLELDASHSSAKSVSDFCLKQSEEDQVSEVEPESAQEAVKTTVIIMILRAYAEALSELR